MQSAEHVGVHFIDHQAGIELREGHRHRGLGHPVGRQDRIGIESERRTRRAQVLDIDGVDGFGA